jgi:PEP-CTERM motif
MKKSVSVVFFVTICLLFVVSNAQAITIDFIDRHITLFQTTTESNAAGDFAQGLSWVNGNFDSPYDSSRGSNVYGARGYQDSFVTNSSTNMTLGGLGDYKVWLPNTEDIDVTIISRFELLFSPMTSATYTFWTSNDGGNVTFKDMSDNTDIYDGTGYLIAGRQYQVVADASVYLPFDPTYGVNTGGYWTFGLDVTEVPSNAPVPEPATMMLFGLGLLGLAGVTRKKR